MLKEKLHAIQFRIAQAAQRDGRDPSEIQLIAVTKNVPVETIREATSLGIRHIGENKVHEAFTKQKEIGCRREELGKKAKPLTPNSYHLSAVTWHFIGHLQTNKVRDAVEIFDWIHSVDSLRLAEKINQECEKIQKIMPVLIEVNVSGEPSKFGIAPKDLLELVKSCQPLSSIRVEGLMTMAPVVSDPNQVRPYFQHLARLRHEILDQYSAVSPSLPASQLPSPLVSFHLSMGMSQDFEAAIEEGATFVRIGSALFE